MPSSNVSPFSFIAWKEDDESLVVSTSINTLGYMVLLEVDGVPADAVIAYAKSQMGESSWQKELAVNFPSYVAALAKEAGRPCFVTTGTAQVEFADINSGEVVEMDLPATSEAYDEAVRVDSSRANHEVPRGMSGAAKESDSDEYESVEDEEDEENEPTKQQAYLQKRHFLDMFATQMETVLSIGMDLGLTIEEMAAAYKKVMGKDHPVPESVEECMAVSSENPALQAYLTKPAGGGEGFFQE